jgi:MFS family permease
MPKDPSSSSGDEKKRRLLQFEIELTEPNATPPSPSPPDLYAKSSSPLRWAVLVLSVLVATGPYYAYDNPAGTQVALREYFGAPPTINENSTAAQNATFADFNVRFQLLYSTYSLPNTVWPVAAGALVDRLGARASNVASTSIALAGHGLVAAGIATQSWAAAWVGRAVFGIGTELMCVSNRMLVADWFLGKGGEVALAMGVLLATGRLSSVANDEISGLFDSAGVPVAFYVGTAFCAASVVAALVAFAVDARHEVAVRRTLNLTREEAARLLAQGKGEELEAEEEDEGAEALDGDGDGDGRPSACARLLRPVRSIWRQVRGWRSAFWLLCALCVTGYCCVVAFNNVASAFIEARYKAAGEDASTERVGTAMAILFISAAVAATFAGSLVDATGCRAGFMLASAVVVTGCHLTLAFTTGGTPLPEAMFAVMGCAFALFAAALWPAVAYVVPKPGLGTAYGLMGAAQNIGLVITPLATGELQPPACTGSYVCVCTLFAGIAVAAVLFSSALVVDEARQRTRERKAARGGRGGGDDEGGGFFSGLLSKVGGGSAPKGQLWDDVDAALRENDDALADLAH